MEDLKKGKAIARRDRRKNRVDGRVGGRVEERKVGGLYAEGVTNQLVSIHTKQA
jgi:hypothetical protein